MHIALRAALSYLWAPQLGLRAVALATGAGWLLMTAFQTLMLRRSFRAERELRAHPGMD